jgi:hypothetical protein
MADNDVTLKGADANQTPFNPRLRARTDGSRELVVSVAKTDGTFIDPATSADIDDLQTVVAKDLTVANVTAEVGSVGSTLHADLVAQQAAIGAPTDALAGDDTGSHSLISFVKRGLTNWTTLLGRIPALVGGRMPVVATGVVSVDNLPATQAVSATALPLPTGAATSAKQDALAALLPTLVSGRTPVDGSGVTQPISAASLPLPSGAATAANQATSNTSLASIDGKTPALVSGGVPTTETGTAITGAALPGGGAGAIGWLSAIWSKLGAVVLAAGANVIGKVGLQIAGSDVANANPVPTAAQASEAHTGQVGGHITIASATMTRPADTVAYAVGDLIANDTVAGSVVPIALSVARANDTTGMIRRVRLKTDDAAFANQIVRAHMFRNSPTVTNGDNGAFLATESGYIGYADITLDRHFSDAEKGFGVPAVGSELNFQPTAGAQTIYVLLEARTGVTPGSAKTFTLVAETFQN